VRSVKAGDAGAIQAFVRRLSTQSRTRRFFSAIHELDQASLARLTAPDDGRDSVLLALAGDGSGDDIVAIGQYAGDPATRSCEIAFVVADQWQGQGLGARLMGALLEHAQKAGFERVEGAVLVDNRPMLTLARRSGFEVLPSDHEPSVRRIVRKIRRTLAAGSEALRPHGGGSGRPMSAAA
jgi:acetyltransferase